MTKQYIFSKYQVNNIDLFIKNAFPQRVIEIDGLSHGFGDEITASQQTVDRNWNYGQGGFSEENKKLIVLTKDDIEYDDETLVTILEYKLGVDRVKSS